MSERTAISVQHSSQERRMSVWLHRRVRTVVQWVVVSAVLCAVWMACAAPHQVSAAQDTQETIQYTVRPGDTLWSIAAQHDDGHGTLTAQYLKQFNGMSSSALRPGQSIRIPL